MLTHNTIPLEEITEESDRVAYSKLIDLKVNMNLSQLVNWICIKSKFEPSNFIGYFHRTRQFSEKQLKFINDVYEQVEAHKSANKRYKDEGYRDELIVLMEEIAQVAEPPLGKVNSTRGELKRKTTELRKGQLVYGRYFKGAENCLAVVPEERRFVLAEKLSALSEKYSQIYRGKSPA